MALRMAPPIGTIVDWAHLGTNHMTVSRIWGSPLPSASPAAPLYAEQGIRYAAQLRKLQFVSQFMTFKVITAMDASRIWKPGECPFSICGISMILREHWREHLKRWRAASRRSPRRLSRVEYGSGGRMCPGELSGPAS